MKRRLYHIAGVVNLIGWHKGWHDASIPLWLLALEFLLPAYRFFRKSSHRRPNSGQGFPVLTASQKSDAGRAAGKS